MAAVNISKITKSYLQSLKGREVDVIYKGVKGQIWWDDHYKICYRFENGAGGNSYSNIPQVIDDLRYEITSTIVSTNEITKNIRNREVVKLLFSSVDGIRPVNSGEPSEKGKNDLRHGPDYKNRQNPNRNKDFNKLLEDEMEKQKKGTVSQGLVKSSYYEDLEDVFIVYPWDTNQVTGTSDEDLGLSYAVQAYGDEFIQLDNNTLEDMKDTLVQYFDDEAFVRDWNINNPNDEDQIESIYDIESPEDLSVGELATYFDYEAYGRDLRLNERMAWNKKYEYWFSDLNLDNEDIEDEDDVIRWS